MWQGSIFNFKALNYWRSSQVEEDSVVIKIMFCKHPRLCSLGVCNCSPFPLTAPVNCMLLFFIITVFIPHSSHAWGGTSLILAKSQYNYKVGKFLHPKLNFKLLWNLVIFKSSYWIHTHFLLYSIFLSQPQLQFAIVYLSSYLCTPETKTLKKGFCQLFISKSIPWWNVFDIYSLEIVHTDTKRERTGIFFSL